jgi:hypothetical protein
MCIYKKAVFIYVLLNLLKIHSYAHLLWVLNLTFARKPPRWGFSHNTHNF